MVYYLGRSHVFTYLLGFMVMNLHLVGLYLNGQRKTMVFFKIFRFCSIHALTRGALYIILD